MTAHSKRKLSLASVLPGLFFLFFLAASAGMLVLPGPANPLLAFSVVGLAMTGVVALRQMAVRAREAEAAIAEGERYIEAVAELSQDVHAIIRIQDGAFLYLNPAVEGMLGFPQDNFMKGGLAYFNSLVHPDDRAALRIRYRAQMLPLARPLDPEEGEEIHEQIFRLKNHHGDYRWFRSRRNVFLRFPDGVPAEMLAVLQDITEQRSYEAALVQAQKAESLAALTRGAAHGLNNTLMGIQGFTDLALGTQDSEERAANLSKVQASVKRATVLCRQMLTHTGQGRPQVVAHSLNEVVKESLPVIEGLLPQGSTLLLDLCHELPRASLDLNQARYALLNLVYNAAESVRMMGGEISIHTSLKRLDKLQPESAGLEGEHLCLEVRDDGPAKTPEVMDKLCDPLFGSVHPEAGLGLSAVQEVMREHRGALHAMTFPDSGGNATRLYFPPAPAAPDLESPQEDAPVASRAGAVLVVEDDPAIRAILRHGLRGAGYTVLEAEDGVEGFGAFVRHRASISVVLLDLTMPRMGGDEVYEEIRKVAPDMPVVLMSGYTQEEATAALGGKPLAGFLSKPCSIQETVEVVGRILNPSEAPAQG